MFSISYSLTLFFLPPVKYFYSQMLHKWKKKKILFLFMQNLDNSGMKQTACSYLTKMHIIKRICLIDLIQEKTWHFFESSP